MNWSSGDNLVTGNFPEEDGVDHRVEPQSWLPEGAPRDQDLGADTSHQGDEQSARAGLATNGNLSSSVSDAAPAADGPRMPSPYPDPPSPYPDPIAAPNAAAGTATSTFGVIGSPEILGTPEKARKFRKAPRAPRARKPPKVQVQAARQAQNGAVPVRRAQLAITRVEPWSVMKFSFMISLVGWVVLFVAVAALYYSLSKIGVFTSIEKSVTDVTSSKASAGVKASNWFSASRVLGYTMLVGAVNVVLITALATVGSVIYNLVTHVAGGIEVTLKETD
jgi:Transmembrane domain of unknown function (DUF3566)